MDILENWWLYLKRGVAFSVILFVIGILLAIVLAILIPTLNLNTQASVASFVESGTPSIEFALVVLAAYLLVRLLIDGYILTWVAEHID